MLRALAGALFFVHINCLIGLDETSHSFHSSCLLRKKTNSKAHEGPGNEPLEPEGIYSAHFQPLYGDNLNARVSLKNAPDGIHFQGLHDGESCPWEDSNNDRVIDLREAWRRII